jgi:hypothetical protein
VNKVGYDTEEILAMIWFGMRVIAFAVGLVLILAGLGSLGTLGELELLQAISTGLTAPILVVVGIILVILGIYPQGIKAIINIVFR